MSVADYAEATFLAASHFQKGRGGETVEIIVIHTTEEPCAPGVARSVANFFKSGATPTSSHYIVGPDAIYQCVGELDVAWHALGANPHSIGIEHTGRAEFTEAQWASPAAQDMLRKSAALAADICKRYEIPVELVDHQGLIERRKGITTHVEVSRAFRKSDHSDPGDHFPLDAWLAMVREAMGNP